MSVIAVIIEGTPIAKKRPRFARRGKFVTTYNCQESEEGKFLMLARQQIPEMIYGPVSVSIAFFMKRPKSHYGTGKNSNNIKQSAPLKHISKPDIDNLQKMVYDCLNRVAWVDDSCVFEAYCRKEYSDRPRTEITIKGEQNGPGHEEGKR